MTDALAKIKNIRGNSKTLLNFFGFKTIRDARKEFNGTDKSIYQYLKSEYNNEVEQILTEQRRVKRNEQAKLRRQAKKMKTFMLNLKVEIIYDKYPDKIFVKDLIEGAFTEPAGNIQKIIDSYNEHDGYKLVKVIGSKVNYLNSEKVKKDRKPKIKQMMKRSYVLKNDWLYYAKNIADYAYDHTDDTCVYHQLTKYLLEPPTGRPTKFITGEKTSPTAIYNFLKSRTTEFDYPNFNSIQDGVSTEQVGQLCREVKRNLYVYDEDDKCFYSELNNNENLL